MLAWTRQQWIKLKFLAADGRLRVWKRKGGGGGGGAGRFDVPNIVERDRFVGEYVMIWGGISRSGSAQLVTASQQ